MQYDILFHVDHTEADMNIAISNIANSLAALEGQACRLVMVVNGPAIKLMVKAGVHAAALQDLLGKGLNIRVCQNAMRKFDLDSEALIPGCRVVPAGIIELVNLQREGFAYIKP